MDFDDLTGKVFDKLSVIGYAGRSNSNKRMYKCQNMGGGISR